MLLVMPNALCITLIRLFRSTNSDLNFRKNLQLFNCSFPRKLPGGLLLFFPLHLEAAPLVPHVIFNQSFAQRPLNNAKLAGQNKERNSLIMAKRETPFVYLLVSAHLKGGICLVDKHEHKSPPSEKSDHILGLKLNQYRQKVNMQLLWSINSSF